MWRHQSTYESILPEQKDIQIKVQNGEITQTDFMPVGIGVRDSRWVPD